MSFDDYQKSDSAMCMHNDFNRKIYEAGAQSRQDEIDELQKRIDKTVEYIECYYGVVELSMIVDILGGKENEH